MLDIFNTYREKTGYINLNNIPFQKIETKIYGSRKNKIWFYWLGEKYCFKANIGPLEEIKEIINECIAYDAHIQNAEYDIAIYQDYIGVITKDFIHNSSYFPLLCLFCEVNKVTNNIYNIVQMFQEKGILEKQISMNVKTILEYHLLDIVTAQRDRNITNQGFIEKDGTLIPAPRYDSANSFLTIAKIDKINQFMHSIDKQKLIEKYRGVRTKLRILPGDTRENSIDELLYATYFSDQTPNVIKNQLYQMDDITSRLSKTNFNLIYQYLQNYNLLLKPMYQDYFKYVFDYKINELLEKTEKVKQYLKT